MNNNTNNTLEQSETVVATIYAHQLVGYDLKNAILIVSVVLNLFFFVTWLALQVTSAYDMQLAGFFLGR